MRHPAQLTIVGQQLARDEQRRDESRGLSIAERARRAADAFFGRAVAADEVDQVVDAYRAEAARQGAERGGSLGSLLGTHRAEIWARWLSGVAAAPGAEAPPGVGALPGLHDLVAAVLDELIATPEDDPAASVPPDLGTRVPRGFDRAAEAAREMAAFRAAVLDVCADYRVAIGGWAAQRVHGTIDQALIAVLVEIEARARVA